MSLLSSIGSALAGPLGGAAITAVGSLISSSQDRKAQAAANASSEQQAWDMWHGTNAENRAAEQRANQMTWDMWTKTNQFNVEQVDKERAWQSQLLSEDRAYNDPAAIRARAEAAGFNPLALLGVPTSSGTGGSVSAPTASMGGAAMGGSTPISPTYRPTISSGIADAAQALGQGFAQYGAARDAATKAEQENQILREALNKKTLRPTVSGVYGGGDVALNTAFTTRFGDPLVRGLPSAETEDVGLESSRRPYMRGQKQPMDDERAPVWVRDPRLGKNQAEQWTTIDAGYADRLALKDGDTWMAADDEETAGEVVSEAKGGSLGIAAALGLSDPNQNLTPRIDKGLDQTYGPFNRSGRYVNRLLFGDNSDEYKELSSRDRIKLHALQRKNRGF